jgi:hypothetical protein
MPYEKSNKEIQESKVKGFKMKGSPMKRNFGIGADSPMKQTTSSTLKGMDFNPYAHKELNASNIPSFRDMVSLEQQQAARKAWKDKRAGRKADEEEFAGELEGAGLNREKGDWWKMKKNKKRRDFIEKQKGEKSDVAKDWYGVGSEDLQYNSETGQYTPKEGSESDTHGTWRDGGWNDSDPNSPTTNIDEGGDFDDENPASESSDEDVLNTIQNVEKDVNANRTA